MGSVLGIISPREHGRRYGAASASFLFLVVLVEVEALMLLAFTLFLGSAALFVDAQDAILPASSLIAVAASAVALWRVRRWSLRQRSVVVAVSELRESFTSSNWRERIGA